VQADRVSEHPLGATFAGVVLFIVGLGIAGGVYQINAKERELRRGWIRTEGRVVDVLKREQSGGPSFVPLIVFQTSSGARVSFTARLGSETPRYSVSQTIPIQYPPGHPESAEIDRRSQRLVRNIVAAAGALILMGLGGTVAWQASRLYRARMPSSR
jgi:hypothetical protein